MGDGCVVGDVGRAEAVGRVVRCVGVLVVVGAVGTFLIRGGGDAEAVAREPGVPQPATIVWEEDFETLPYGTPPPLTSDSGRDMYGNGVGYSSDPHWQPSYTNTAFCNGFIVNSEAAAGSAFGVSDNCQRIVGRDGAGEQQSAWWFAQNAAYALGAAQGALEPASNNAVAEMTRDDSDAGDGLMPNNGNAMLRTSNLMVDAGHYYQASVWTASANCAVDSGVGADPELSVGLYVNNGVIPVAATEPTSPCEGGVRQSPDAAGTQFYTAHYATDIVQIARELSYSGVSVEVRNTQLAITGNDSAFDLPMLRDATPWLDQSFSVPMASGGAGFASTLTYTITNTDELAAKPVLSFTNTLPYGVTPVVGSEASTCASAQVSVVGQQVSFSGGLLAGDSFCVVSVEVAAAQSGSYTNDVYAFADYANTGHYKPWGLREPMAATLVVATVARVELAAATDVDSVDAATENVVYNFVIANRGNVALSNLALDYSGFSGDANSTSPMTCSETPWLGLEDLVLQAGESVECFFTYKVTQGDIDRQGGIDLVGSVARGVVVADQSSVVSNAVTLHVAAGTRPSLTFAQVAVRGGGVVTDAPLVAGETISYYFVVSNVSNATVTDVSVEETAFSGMGNLAITCPQDVLAPFEIMSCTASYVVTAADVTNGSISNTANARGVGTDETVEVVVTTASDTAWLPEPAEPGIIIANAHTPLPADDTRAGDQLEYIFTVANTGNVSLRDVQITSDVHSDGALDVLVDSDCVNWPSLGTMEPGEVVVCRANYVLTQEDIDRGGAIAHVASVVGMAGGGSSVSASATDQEEAYPVTAPDLTLTRMAPSEVKDGDIEYTYNIYNNGNTTLTGVTLSDDTSGAGVAPVPSCIWPLTVGVLAPGQSATCVASYQTTGSDILAKLPIVSTASVNGVDESGKIGSSVVEVTTNIVRGEAGTISGHLYMDHNMDWHFEAEHNEPRIADTEIRLSGADIYGNVVERSVLTNERGEYTFDDLYPGTYTAIRPRNSYNHISVSSSGGYYQVNKDGNPLPSEKNGVGSAEDESVSKDIIQNIRIDEGDYNQGNDFGETCGSIGNLIWMDLDRDGYVDEGEPGIEGVEVALYLDNDGDGLEDEFLRTTITDVNGNYYFSVLDLNYRDAYLIQITDGNGALSAVGLEPTFTATQTDFHFDNCSSNVEDGVAYADTEIEIVENDAKVSWFDWMHGVEEPDLVPAVLEARLYSLMAPMMVQLADDSLVSNNSNLTADFGFMTTSGVVPVEPGEGGGDVPEVPGTGVLLRVGDFVVRGTDFVAMGAVVIVSLGGGVWGWRRWRR